MYTVYTYKIGQTSLRSLLKIHDRLNRIQTITIVDNILDKSLISFLYILVIKSFNDSMVLLGHFPSNQFT